VLDIIVYEIHWSIRTIVLKKSLGIKMWNVKKSELSQLLFYLQMCKIQNRIS